MEMKKYKLGEIAENITDGEHGTVIDDDNGKFFLLSNKNIINGEVVITNNDRKINKTTFDKLNKRTKLEVDDILLSTVGTLGKTAIIKKEPNYIVQRSVGIIKPNKEKVSPYFLKYYFDNPSFQKRLIKLSKGAVQKCLFIGDLQNLEISLPPLATQQKIAAVLSSLDKKISLNRKINDNLEAMAKQLYDYYFVQFDFPNEQGKPYKTSGGAMVWNEKLKREIPAGWECSEISKYIEIKSGYSFKSENYIDSGRYKVITIKNVQDGLLETATCDFVNDIPSDMKDWCNLQIGDILISLTGNCGRVCLVTENDLLLNQRVGIFSCDQKFKYFTYLLFRSAQFQKVCNLLANGAAQANLSPIDLCKTLICIPNNDILIEFNKIMHPIITQFIQTTQQSQSLTAQRDALLPLLMNGQVSVE